MPNEIQTLLRGSNPQQIARDLLADPAWSGFNALWKAPGELEALCAHFGLTNVSQAAAFAEDVRQRLGIRLPEIAQWINPRPGVLLDELEQVEWPEIEAAVVGGLKARGMTHAQFLLEPWDWRHRLPTREQLTRIMASCPARRLARVNNDADCDDHCRIMRGWLSAHGLGPLAVGFATYRGYDTAGADIGGHIVGLAVLAERAPLPDGSRTVRSLCIVEPADGRLYPLGYTLLGGLRAARIAFQRVIF